MRYPRVIGTYHTMTSHNHTVAPEHNVLDDQLNPTQWNLHTSAALCRLYPRSRDADTVLAAIQLPRMYKLDSGHQLDMGL